MAITLNELTNATTDPNINTLLQNHTHQYAGSSSVGGSANSVANYLKAGTKQYNGSSEVILNASDIGAAATEHTHQYAGSPTVGGAANSVVHNLTAGTKTYNGSKDVELTYTDVGAAAKDHTHEAGPISVTWENIKQLILDNVYPVGSIYLTTTNTNPQSKLGGTWTAYGQSDTYLRLGGSSTGGSNSVKLTSSNIPSLTTGNASAGHTHTVSGNTGNQSASHTHTVSVTVQKGAHYHHIDTLVGWPSDTQDTVHTEKDWTGWKTGTRYVETIRQTNVESIKQPNGSYTPSVHTHTTSTTVCNQSASHSHSVNLTSGGQSANHTHTYTNNSQSNVTIEPKYVQVYAWKRTA